MHKPLTGIKDVPYLLQALYLHWSATHVRDVPPRLDQLPLHRMHGSLDHAVVSEILRDEAGNPTDFQFLYVGGQVSSSFFPAVAGQSASTVEGFGTFSAVWATYRHVAVTGQPTWARFPSAHAPASNDEMIAVLLPLPGPDGEVAHVFAGVIPALPDHGAVLENQARQAVG